MRNLLFALPLIGCHTRADTLDWDTGNVPDDEEQSSGGSGTDSAEEEDEHSCSSVTLDLLGPDEPVVGDTWTIWMDCDGTRLLGPMVIHFEPSDFVDLDDNVAIFQYAGTAELSVRSGVYDLSEEVTVSGE